MYRVAWMATLAIACTGTPSSDPTPPGAKVIRIAGSSSLTTRLLPALAEEYTRLHPNVRFEVNRTQSGAGIRSLLEGEVDLAAAGRSHHPSEQEQALVYGIDLKKDDARHLVAVDVVALTIHPDNPISSLTYDQVIGIYCTRQTDSWDLLGLEEAPIRAITRGIGSGTRALFEDFFCGPRGIHELIETRNSPDMANILAVDPNALGYTTMADQPGKVLGLRPDAESPAIQPSQANIIRGVYPLYRDLYLYTNPDKASAEVRDFIAFIDSPAGQEIVDEEGFVPLFLRPDRMDGPRPLRETVHFEPHSSTITPRSQARLKLLGKELKDRAGEYRHVVLEGYTDSQESEPQTLSEERAQAVAQTLKADLPDLFFEVIPRGASNPLAPNATPHGRHRNRRVQVYLAEEEVEEDG